MQPLNSLTNRAVVTSTVDPDRVLRNLIVFGRTLRDSGLPIGDGQLISFVDALSQIDIRRRDDFYFASRATLVTRPEQLPIFNAEFARFWRRLMSYEPPPVETFVDADQPASVPLPELSQQRRGAKSEGHAHDPERERTILAIDSGDDETAAGNEEDVEAPPEDVLIFSAREQLRKKDFAQFTPEELAEARRLIEQMDWRLGTRETRRRERAIHGEFIDARATLRRSLRHGGMPLELRRRTRKERMQPLVLICDISGSMDRYARLLLRFVHALKHGLDSVEVFVFSTRLTRITRQLRKRDVDRAITEVVEAVDDWSGGTRIGEAIKHFNYHWSRRVLRSGATVVIISDGWDRGDPVLLAQEMARLQRSCRRLIWLNPLLGAPGYQPLTQGIRAALPFVDNFLPVHNLQSLEALAELLGAMSDQAPVRGFRRPPIVKS